MKSKIEILSNNLLLMLYDAKQNELSLKQVREKIDLSIIESPQAMFEVIEYLNDIGLIKVVLMRGIGSHFFTSIKENYITDKGVEHIKETFV